MQGGAGPRSGQTYQKVTLARLRTNGVGRLTAMNCAAERFGPSSRHVDSLAPARLALRAACGSLPRAFPRAGVVAVFYGRSCLLPQDEEGTRQNATDGKQHPCRGNEIGKRHQGDADDHGFPQARFAAVNKGRHSDGTKDDGSEEGEGSGQNLTCTPPPADAGLFFLHHLFDLFGSLAGSQCRVASASCRCSESIYLAEMVLHMNLNLNVNSVPLPEGV